MKIDNTNDWKFEISAVKNNKKWIRWKIYSKTLDLLTSKGVTNKKTEDPLADLLLPNKYSKNSAKSNYKKNIFCTDDGYVTSRLETSFYGS